MTITKTIPPNAWDTHIHVFDPNTFPYALPRSYTPAPASITSYPVPVTGCKKIVIVHASMQGVSPAPLLDTLAKAEATGYTLRGLATIDPDNITDEELDALHAAGVRGARLHEMAWGHGKQADGGNIAVKVAKLAARLARLEWAIGIFCPVAAWAGMADMIRELDPRVKLVADHLGGTFPGEEHSEEFSTFLDLVREGRLWVKVSGFERLYHGHPEGMEAIKPIVKAVVDAGPDRIVFGTDWPHTQLGVSRKGKSDKQRIEEVEGFREVDDGRHIECLREWMDESVWQKMWVGNPEVLFK